MCVVSPYVCQCCYVRKAVSLVSFFPSGLLIFPSTEFPKPQLEGFDKDTWFRVEWVVSHSLHVVLLWVSGLVLIYGRRKLL